MLRLVALHPVQKKRSSLFRLLPLAIGLLPLFTSGFAKASPQYGINAVYYEVTDIPPTMSDVLYPSCGSEIENNLNRSFDGEPFESCPNDMFMVHYTGFITLPQHESIRFWIAADDGGTIKIAETEWGDWNDKGCSAIETDALTLEADVPLPLDAWYYENGGNSCYMLAWNIDDQGWQIVPDEAFTITPTLVTTTTTSTTTTTENSQWTTTTVLTPTVIVTTTSSIASLPDNQNSNDTPTETTVIPTIAPTPTYEEPTETVSAPDTVVEITDDTVVTETPVDTVADTPTDTIVDTPEVEPETVPVPEETIAELQNADIESMSVEEFSQALEAVLENPISDEQFDEIIGAVLDQPLTEEQFSALVDVLESDTITEEQVSSAVDQIIELGITEEQATELATSEKVLESIDAEQAAEIFAKIPVDEITEEQAQAIVDAVQNASTEVKEAFEEEINIYEGKFDSYVPTGSTIPVSTRRVLTAVAGAFFITPVTTSASGKRR